MPHRRSLLLAACRIVLGALPLSVAACAGEARVTVVVDTTASGGALEVLAIPVDPATIASPADADAPARNDTPRADTIARFVALRDSAQALDEHFQRQRHSLNAEAKRFASLERTSAEYARAWDAHRARSVEAERLRATRDRLRERVAALQARLGNAAPPDDSTRRAAALAARLAALEAATDGERRARRTGARAGLATLALAPGAWWIGAATRGAMPFSFTRIEIGAGARDTVRLRR